MNAKEFRIGNYFTPPNTGYNESTTVMYLGLKKGIETYINSHKESECNPIPLTDELLIRLGFEKVGGNSIMYKLGDFEMGWYGNKFATWYITYLKNEKTSELYSHIRYAHELQNLYFLLTNKELTLKL